MANKFYISLPSPPTPGSKAGARRSPLTPPTITPPSLSAHHSCASIQDSGFQVARATALLSKVASRPSSPRRDSPSSAPPSPTARSSGDDLFSNCSEDGHFHSFDISRYWSTCGQQGTLQPRNGHPSSLVPTLPKTDGYISFPDFEKFCHSQQHESCEVRRASA